MSTTKKVLIVIAVIVGLIVFGVVKLISDLNSDGYVYYGGWEDTPIEALKAEKDSNGLSNGEYDVAELLDTYYFEDEAVLLYVSKADTLVRASFVQNEDGEWHFHGYSEEEDLSTPCYFILDGDLEQQIYDGYTHLEEEQKVFGWKLTSASPIKINGEYANTKTYKFQLKGKEWSIDYFYADNVHVDNPDEGFVKYEYEE